MHSRFKWILLLNTKGFPEFRNIIFGFVVEKCRRELQRKNGLRDDTNLRLVQEVKHQ